MEQMFFPVTQKKASQTGVERSSAANKNAIFPTQLRDLRREKGVSQDELSKILGVSKSTLGLWETGDTLPDARSLHDLAVYYGVSADYLLGLTDVQTSDIDTRAVCKHIGLSEIAFQWLSNLNSDTSSRENILKGLNALLECDRFEDLCLCISEMIDKIKNLPDNAKWTLAEKQKVFAFLESESVNIQSNTMGLYRISNAWDSVYAYRAYVKEEFSDLSNEIFDIELSKKPDVMFF